MKTKRSILFFLKIYSENMKFDETKKIVSVLQKNGSASFSNIIESDDLEEVSNKFYSTIANKYISAYDSSIDEIAYVDNIFDIPLHQRLTDESYDITEKVVFLEKRFDLIYNKEKVFYDKIVNDF